MDLSNLSPEIERLAQTLKSAFADRMQENSSGGVSHIVDNQALKHSLLTVLSHGSMTSAEIRTEISSVSGGLWQPSEGDIYPALQELVDANMISFDLEKDVKRYSVLAAGAEWLAGRHASSSAHENPGTESKQQGHSPNLGSKLSAKSDFLRSSALVGQAVASVVAKGDHQIMKAATTHLELAASEIFGLLGKSE